MAGFKELAHTGIAQNASNVDKLDRYLTKISPAIQKYDREEASRANAAREQRRREAAARKIVKQAAKLQKEDPETYRTSRERFFVDASEIVQTGYPQKLLDGGMLATSPDEVSDLTTQKGAVLSLSRFKFNGADALAIAIQKTGEDRELHAAMRRGRFDANPVKAIMISRDALSGFEYGYGAVFTLPIFNQFKDRTVAGTGFMSGPEMKLGTDRDRELAAVLLDGIKGSESYQQGLPSQSPLPAAKHR